MADHERTSPAVMAQRITPPDSLEYFPTPPWATRALLYETVPDCFRRRHVACDPCCGEGHMVRPLSEYFPHVHKADIFDYGLGFPVRDFLYSDASDYPGGVDWFILNPPFSMALDFVNHALPIAREGVAVFIRLQWLEGADRFNRLFNLEPPQYLCPFSDRVPLIEGAWDPEASSATAYAWFVWQKTKRFKKSFEVVFIRPGACQRHTRIEDMRLAKPGEAARRKKAREAASDAPDDQPSLLELEI